MAFGLQDTIIQPRPGATEELQEHTLMDVSWGSANDSRATAGGDANMHPDRQTGRHGRGGKSSGEAATTFALAVFQTVPGLRAGLDNALVSLGLGAGTTGREGQIGGDRIFSD